MTSPYHSNSGSHHVTRTAAGAIRLAAAGDAFVAGSHKFIDPQLADTAARLGPTAAWVAAFEQYGTAAPTKVHGDFAVAIRDHQGRIFLAVDRFAVRTLCYRIDGDAVVVHERADVVADPAASWDPQAIYDYLYFHVIPAPRTIFKGVQRLPAAHCACLERGRLTVAPWWNPVFQEHHREPFEPLRDEFRSLLRGATERQIEGANSVGCFLSGGTDSSTVAGLLTEVTGKPARTFSIGFDAEGYDEMEYARIAARHFKTDHHEYYVTPDDLVTGIPAVAASYDQPFGNSSVVPSFYCAKLARDAGVDRILGGDGGDELFGGNTRYAKQRVFGFYDQVPGSLRRGLFERLLLGSGAIGRLPILRKAASYVEQARVSMPDRLQMYNLLGRLGLAEVLTPEFLSAVDSEEPAHQQRGVYAACEASALINKMLFFDWRYTLADNDLPKVVGATALAGIPVGFPFLDDALVDFSLKLEPKLKLKRLQLRWFFKAALRGFLPKEILAKKKHGFGLPFGVWVTKHTGLKALALDSVHDLGQRGVVRREFLDRLVKEHLPQHPGYYGEMVWILIMMEQWMLSVSRELFYPPPLTRIRRVDHYNAQSANSATHLADRPMNLSLRQHYWLDHLPWALAGPMKRRAPPPTGYYMILSTTPLVVLIPEDFNDDMPRWLPFFDALKRRPVHFLCLIRGAVERSPDAHMQSTSVVLESHKVRYPKHTFTMLANNLSQQRMYVAGGIKSAFVNHNALVNETYFRVDHQATKRFDAIHNGVLAPYKRHELAQLVPRLAIVTYLQPQHAKYFARISESLASADWMNFSSRPIVASGYKSIPRDQLGPVLSQAKVGLCLSAAEGAMVSSIEYLLCGLPIVSTESLGGRDVFFDNEFVQIVEPNPESVRTGVQQVIERRIDPDMIRARTLERIERHRKVFVDLILSICAQSGVNRESSEVYASLFPREIYKLRPLHMVVAL